MMNEFFSFAHLSPLFFAIILVLTAICAFAGHWIGSKIGQGIESGIGAFFVILLISLMVVGGMIPIAMFLTMGEFFTALMNNPDVHPEDFDMDVNVALTLALGGVLGGLFASVIFFIAALIGMAKGRS